MAEKVRLPVSEGGLVRYYDEGYQSKFVIKPESVIGLCIAVAIICLVLLVYGQRFFGI